jgi:hypothetical protein
MIEQLTQEHDRLHALADQLDCFLDAETMPTDPAFSRLRWTMLRQLSTHFAAERHALSPARNDPAIAGLFASLDSDLDGAIDAHMLEWSAARMQAAWPNYRSAARALLKRLRRRMRYEEGVLYPAITARG